jgi:hypothetical protein
MRTEFRIPRLEVHETAKPPAVLREGIAYLPEEIDAVSSLKKGNFSS